MEKLMRMDNPWKGLQSYQENDIIYGRDEEITQLYTRILYNLQTVVYGKSGIGKSSIINAGIIPRAKLDGMLPVSIRLAHTTKKEQHATDPYTLQVKKRIEEELLKAGGELEEIVPHQEGHCETLWELLHRHRCWVGTGDSRKPVTPLLLFDQFEEIFTLEINAHRVDNFFSELADLLNEIKPEYLTQQEREIQRRQASDEHEMEPVPKTRNVFSKIATKQRNDSLEYLEKSEFHVVITLREDFLSYLERHTVYIPSMKQNRFALLPLNEEQAAKIIMEPIGGLIDKSVAAEIIQRVTGKTDFKLDGIPEIEVDAALLSLYMEQLYKRKRDDDDVITAEMVLQYSDDIIKNFYEDSIKDIPDDTIKYLEDELLTNANRRNNVARVDLIIGGVSEEALDKLISKKVLRQFSYSGDLRIELIHDILCPIVNERIEHREQLAREREEQKRQEEDKRQLLLAEERKRQEVERKAAEEKQRIQEEASRQRKRNRARVALLLSLLFVGLFLWALWFVLFRKEYKVCYASFTTKNGWPIGLGKELSNQDKKELPLYYQLVREGYFNHSTSYFVVVAEYLGLVRKGYFNHSIRVNVMNEAKSLSQNVFYESPLVRLYETEGTDERAKAFAHLQRQTAYWIFTPDLENRVSRQTAYNKNGEELYAVQFFRSSIPTDDDNNQIQVQEKQLWANYIDNDGKALCVRDNGADRVRITVDDSTGYNIGYQFFSEIGVPQPNVDGFYGYRYVTDADGRITERIPLDAFGDAIDSMYVAYTSFDDYGRWVKASNGSAQYSKEMTVYKWSHRTDSLRYRQQGELYYHSELISDTILHRYIYNENQVAVASHYSVVHDSLLLKNRKEILPQNKPNLRLTQEFWADSVIPYYLTSEESKKGQYIIRYFCGNTQSQMNKPYMIETSDDFYTYKYHEIIIDTIYTKNGHIKVSKKYMDAKGDLSDACEVNCNEIYYNANHEMRKQIQYKNGTIITSYLYDNENGQIVAQYVMDEDSKPIRYPQWDKYRLTYYKLKLVYDFSKRLVAIKGINEFGEESLITRDNRGYLLSPVPSSQMEKLDNSDGGVTNIFYGLQFFKESLFPIEITRKVEYIHILDKEGTWYKAGIRNGDLLIEESPHIKIARPNISKNTYDILFFSPKQGRERGAEHYAIYFTEREMNRYNYAVK